MTRFDSLRLRFLAGGLAWILLGLVAAGFVVSGVFRAEMRAQIENELGEHMFELETLIDSDDDGAVRLHRPLSDPRFSRADSGFFWQVRKDGVAVLRSSSLGTGTLQGGAASADPQLEAGIGPDGATFVYGVTRAPHPGSAPLEILVAADRNVLEATVAHFNTELVRALVAFGLLLGLIGGALVGFGLRPLDRLRAAVGDIRSGRTQRMPVDFPAEIRPLVSDLNKLLDATGDMVQRARIGAGNLAHGLRTPLAVQMDEAKRLEAAGASEAAATMMAQCLRMERQIDYHLARAGAVGPGRVAGVTTGVAERVEGILSALRRLHAGRAVAFANVGGADSELRAACDGVDLGEMVSNLVDNAGKWARSRVEVGWLADGGNLVIAVDDDGPGLAPELRAQAFAIGERLDDAVPGSGLGLAIVRDLARLYGGDASLADSPLGGLRAVLTLPLAV